MTNRINPYNVYAKCDGKGPASPGYCFTQNYLLGAPASQTVIPCINVTLPSDYLNRKDVQEGNCFLHVKFCEYPMIVYDPFNFMQNILLHLLYFSLNTSSVCVRESS